MSGVPFWGMDQGGFCVEDRYVAAQQEFDKTGVENSDLTEWRELQARWNQFGCFIPLYRAHGQWPLREVWNIAPESHPCYQTIVYYDKLRYRMMPYLYSMAGWAHLNDYTLMRALVMDFQNDEKVYDIKDQWMFGPAFMACPVGQYKARNRKVYFPKASGWYNLYDGEFIEGGQSLVVDAPFERIPVFVREGSIVPFGPEIQYSSEKPASEITLYVYAGRNGQFQLYEDEGTNYDYEKGKYATIDISYDDASKNVSFSQRKGSFSGMLKSRTFKIVLVTKDNAQPLDFNAAGKVVTYTGKAVSVKL
jgi:alpha-D-xyloside xylohydrolase